MEWSLCEALGRARDAGESLLKLHSLASNTIDLTVTSPPWDGIFDYQGKGCDNHMTWKLFTTVVQELERLTKPGGIVCWDYADKVKNNVMSGNLMRMGAYFLDNGFVQVEGEVRL